MSSKHFAMNTTTIAAIATPAGTGGVGIVKISGPQAIRSAASIFAGGRPVFSSPPRFAGADCFHPRKMHYGYIIDPETGRVIDEVMVVAMPGPRSYTCEDVVEIQAHGGMVVLQDILSLLLRRGLHLAEPGEFTQRAFLNGRIDLAQAEAVMDIVSARSRAAIDIAQGMASGRLSGTIHSIRNAISETLSVLEAHIDFPEDLDASIDFSRMLATLRNEVLTPVESLLSSFEQYRHAQAGFRIVIAGPTNAGKSSIMNRLCDADRSIVTDIPGTTRDYIETCLVLSGSPISLVDTAGLRSDPDAIEKIGMEKTLEALQSADLILSVFDATTIDPHTDLSSFFPGHSTDQVIVINKTDLTDADSDRDSGFQSNFQTVNTSALQGTGIAELKRIIAHKAQKRYDTSAESPVPNYRHTAILNEALLSLRAAEASMERHESPELAAIDLYNAHDLIGQITGETASPEILERIFENYCIGK